MNHKVGPLWLLAILIFSSLACEITIGGNQNDVSGSGDVIQESRQVSGVHSVQVSNQGNLFIEIGNEEKLVVEAHENLMRYIRSDVQNGQLILETVPNVNLKNSKPINYYLTVKSLDEIEVTSSGDVQAPSLLADDFHIRVSSSGDVSIADLVADQLEVNITSSGDVAIKGGQVGTQDIKISSSGNYSAENLESQQVGAKISSSGDSAVRVSDILDASISSSGNLYYYGDPSVNSKETSSGNVVKRGD